MSRRSRFFRYDADAGQVVEVKREQRVHLPQYPIKSDALGVHPDQIGEAREFDRANGVPTDYTPDGRPILTDARHFYRYRRAHGFHQRNSYTS